MKKQKNVYDCLFCGEELILKKDGWMKDKITNRIMFIYICEECDQAFGLSENNVLGVLPFDSKMESTASECIRCGKKEPFKQKMAWLVNDMALMKPHCSKCASIVIKEYFKGIGNKDPLITEENALELAEVHNLHKMNEIFNDPKRMKEIEKSEPVQEMKRELGLITKEDP